jgi:hypothetical protein
MNIKVHFTVIATSEEHVIDLLKSADSCGFDESMFTILWNDHTNLYEPYSVINSILEHSKFDFEILCHQDIRFVPEYGASKLKEMLLSMNENVSVYGLAGVSKQCEWYCCVIDETVWPEGDVTFISNVVGVTHVDECFICFSTRNRTEMSKELSGFHCYGTDACLNALASGYQTALIPFKIRHLSTGDFGTDFHNSLERFCDSWSKRAIGYSQRGGYCVIAPNGWCRKLLGRHKVRTFLLKVLGKSIVFFPTKFGVKAKRTLHR